MPRRDLAEKMHTVGRPSGHPRVPATAQKAASTEGNDRRSLSPKLLEALRTTKDGTRSWLQDSISLFLLLLLLLFSKERIHSGERKDCNPACAVRTSRAQALDSSSLNRTSFQETATEDRWVSVGSVQLTERRPRGVSDGKVTTQSCLSLKLVICHYIIPPGKEKSILIH